jgi:multisubunit Na+/H+ antiporter MnhB subunit
MGTDDLSSERTPSDFIRFGLGFLGFILAIAGTILTSPGLALAGGLLLLLVISSYALAEQD